MSGKITRTQDREAARHTAAILKLQRAEVKMVRAMRAWDKARLAVRRYDIKADKRFAEIPGALDIRDLTYRKIMPGEPMYEMVQADKAAGRHVCDSWDHNEPGGCSNPGCFKYRENI